MNLSKEALDELKEIHFKKIRKRLTDNEVWQWLVSCLAPIGFSLLKGRFRRLIHESQTKSRNYRYDDLL